MSKRSTFVEDGVPPVSFVHTYSFLTIRLTLLPTTRWEVIVPVIKEFQIQEVAPFGGWEPLFSQILPVVNTLLPVVHEVHLIVVGTMNFNNLREEFFLSTETKTLLPTEKFGGQNVSGATASA